MGMFDNPVVIKSFPHYLRTIQLEGHDRFILYRGQDCDKPLLPKIARLRHIHTCSFTWGMVAKRSA